MNFRDFSKDDKQYYDKIKWRDDDIDWVLRNLALFTVVFVIATLIIIIFT